MNNQNYNQHYKMSYSKLDPSFKYEIMKKIGSEKIHMCFQCGTCSADCPVSRLFNLYKPRNIARMVQLGFKERLLSNESLWFCTTCHTCVDHCPQGVKISSIVRTLRNLSVLETLRIPEVFMIFASNILKTGSVYLMPESRHRRREIKGLPKLQKSTVEDLETLFKNSFLVKNKLKIQTFNPKSSEVETGDE